MNKLDKRNLVDNLKNNIAENNFILTGFNGLSVSEIEKLRNDLRKASYTSNVVKNRLLIIALKELGIEGIEEYLEDKTILSIQKDSNSFEGLKIISSFSKNNDKLFIKAGYINGKIFNSIDVERIASLPSKEVLISRLLAQMNAPISKLVHALNTPISKLVYVLEAIKNKK